MRYDLDLTRPAFEKVRGHYRLYGAWVGERVRPCLAVLPMISRNPTPLVVTVDDAWLWNPDDRDADPAHSARLVMQFLATNGEQPDNVFEHMKIMSLIHDHLGDLICIPPKPITDSVVVADILRTDNDTGKVTHIEVTERV